MMKFNLHKTVINSNFELDINFELNKGDFLSIFGESGAGKTTILRLIAGLENVQKGNIFIDDIAWVNSENKINLKPQQRKIGFVFQNNSLFPNMTVIENLEFALLKNQSKSIIEELIETIELKELKDRTINSLSGGQKQKVALARALVQKPSILLLDEPLSAIDDINRTKLQNYILKIHHQYNLTTILVTHNLPEVFKLSNKVMKLKNGKLESFGTPQGIFLNNKNTSNIKLIGIILNKKIEDTDYIIEIKLDTNIISKTVSANEYNKFSIGETIEIKLLDYKTKIQKLQ